MAKPALGRGLGNLLGNAQIAAKPEPPPESSPDVSNAEVSTGLGNLLRAGKSGEAQIPAAVSQPAAQTAGIRAPRWVFIAADLLLLGLTSLFVMKNPGPLGVWEVILCVAAVSVGAMLACLAVLRPR